MSIAVMDNDEVFAKCYSVAGDDAETAFQACSISKAANALATMKLVDEGRLTLGGKLLDLLPTEYLDIILDGSPAGQKPLIENITIKQLLSHTSGLAPASFPGYSSSAAVPTMHEIIAGKMPANTTRFRLVSLPGHKFEYSGAGSTLLQLILESVCGKSYRALMQDIVLTPLQMTHSFYNSREEKNRNLARAHRTGYTECDARHHYLPELAAAGLWTTPTDLLKLIRDVQKSVTGEGGILKQSTAKEMLVEVDGGFSLGWQSRDSNPAVFGHSGSNEPGFRSLSMGFLDHDKNHPLSKSGIVVMTNADTGDLLRAQCMQAISALKGWPFPEHEVRAQRLGRLPSESGDDWKAWKGEWKSRDGHSFLMKEDPNGLPLLVYDGLGEVVLLPTVDGRRGKGGGFLDFVLQGLPLLSIALETDGGLIKLQRLRGESEELKREKVVG
ncbi:hypothetical protein V2A60_007380 [Cordyceps javanica]